jgi:hypothetical protein
MVAEGAIAREDLTAFGALTPFTDERDPIDGAPVSLWYSLQELLAFLTASASSVGAVVVFLLHGLSVAASCFLLHEAGQR